MIYDENSFLQGITVGQTLQGINIINIEKEQTEIYKYGDLVLFFNGYIDDTLPIYGELEYD